MTPTMEWQGMESAPRDGTWILAVCNFGRGQVELRIVRYVTNHLPWREHGEFGPFVWNTQDERPNIGTIAEKIPTHWMPLPEPPTPPTIGE